jgi:hypothetical protein
MVKELEMFKYGCMFNQFSYRVTRIKRNPCLGWDVFKIESKQMIGICFIKIGNTVKTETV